MHSSAPAASPSPLLPTTVPAPVAAVLSRLPAYPAALLLTTALNVSVDSLDPERFAAITGHDRLPEVLDGIAAAKILTEERIAPVGAVYAARAAKIGDDVHEVRQMMIDHLRDHASHSHP